MKSPISTGTASKNTLNQQENYVIIETKTIGKGGDCMFNLFNSVGNNQNNFFSSMNFADYASIRNGSYNKLVKAYYAKTDSGSSSNSASTGTNRTSDKKYWDYNEKIKNPPKKDYHYWNYNEKIKGEKAPGEKFVDIKNAASNVKSPTSSM